VDSRVFLIIHTPGASYEKRDTEDAEFVRARCYEREDQNVCPNTEARKATTMFQTCDSDNERKIFRTLPKVIMEKHGADFSWTKVS